MTALDRYVRLESGGLWRADTDAQRRDVVISFGDATLVISDPAGRPLTHWSLPAITRLNPGERPAVFAPDDDASEAVEIAEDTMIDAIEEVRRSLAKDSPKPGKLRHWITGGLILSTLALAIFWLPGALTRQTLAVVPLPKRMEIGATILGHMQGQTGAACRDPRATEAANRLTARLFGAETMTQLIVVPKLPQGAIAIPGGLIILDYGVLRASDDPAVAAGYVLAAGAAGMRDDPLEGVLDRAGLGVTFRLLTTGEIPPEILHDSATVLAAAAPVTPPVNLLRTAFEAAEVPSTPYATAVDIDLSPDPFAQQSAPTILNDSDWVSLQNICNT